MTVSVMRLRKLLAHYPLDPPPRQLLINTSTEERAAAIPKRKKSGWKKARSLLKKKKAREGKLRTLGSEFEFSNVASRGRNICFGKSRVVGSR